MRGPTVLLVTSVRFWEEQRGSQQRIASLVRQMVRDGSVVRTCFVGRMSPAEIGLARRGGFGAVLPAQADLPDDYYVPDCSLGHFHHESVRAHVHLLVRDMQPDVVMIEYVELSYVVRGLENMIRHRPLLVIDTHDVIHERCARFRESGHEHWVQITRQEEADALKPFDVVVAIQNEDAQKFQMLAPHAEVITVPHAIELPDVISRIADPSSPQGKTVLGYLAVGNAPNITSLEWFLERCWSLVLEQLGTSVHLLIGGEVGQRVDLSGMRQVSCAGVTSSLEEFYEQVDIAINPVRFGGGLKIKNVEAMAFGLPLVTTSVGAEGMQDAEGVALLVGDTPEEFAEAVATLAGSSEARVTLSAGGRAFAERHYTPRVAFQPLFNAFGTTEALV
ncbi:MAG: glycosyltransferase family 4 protein [Phycisphaerales bacterium JB043]